MVFAALVVPLLEAGDGVKVGPPALIEHADSPAGAVDRAGALAVWREHGCIEIARLAADATPGAPVQLGCGASGAPRAASSGDVTLVVWPAGGELAAALVTPELHVTALHPKGEHPAAVSAAYDGTRFLVATASCSAADLIVFDRAGAAAARTVLKTSKPHDDLSVSGAVVACEGDRCEVAYSIANRTLPIAGGCLEQIRKPRWASSYTAPVTAGVPGTFQAIDWTDESRPTYPTKLMITRHGLTWALSGYVNRSDTAIGAFGTLTARTNYYSELWNGRETVTPDTVQVELVPNGPNVAHHAPLAVPNETAPAVLALGGDRFVLLTAARDAVVARAIAIDPAWFTHPPQAPGPVLVGTLRTANHKPPANARVWCLIQRTGCGAATVRDDGTFVLPVADPLDFRVAAQTDRAVIAYSADEYWFTPALHETRAAIQLVAAAHIVGTVAWPSGKLPKATPLPVEREEYGPRAGAARRPPEDPLTVTFEAHGLLPVIAPSAMAAIDSMYSYGLHVDGTFDVPVAATGRALLIAQTRNKEYGASTWVKTEPGKATRVELAMKKTSKLVIRLEGHRMVVGDDMRLVANTFGCMDGGSGCMFEHIAPGPELVSFSTPDWTMLRAIDVPPGTTKIVDLPFVPDLAPGDAGVHVARAIDGITVTAVAPGGPAAGLLKPDDVITAIDGAPVGSDVAAAIAKLRGAPDSRVEVTITRARRSQKLTLTRAHGSPAP